MRFWCPVVVAIPLVAIFLMPSAAAAEVEIRNVVFDETLEVDVPAGFQVLLRIHCDPPMLPDQNVVRVSLEGQGLVQMANDAVRFDVARCVAEGSRDLVADLTAFANWDARPGGGNSLVAAASLRGSDEAPGQEDKQSEPLTKKFDVRPAGAIALQSPGARVVGDDVVPVQIGAQINGPTQVVLAAAGPQSGWIEATTVTLSPGTHGLASINASIPVDAPAMGWDSLAIPMVATAYQGETVVDVHEFTMTLSNDSNLEATFGVGGLVGLLGAGAWLATKGRKE